MSERRKFGEFKQNRFITFVEIDNSCGIEDLMKEIRYKGFGEKDFQKLCSIREELNQLYYENEELKEILHEVEHELISITGLSAFDKCASHLGYVEVFDEDRIELDYSKLLKRIEKVIE